MKHLNSIPFRVLLLLIWLIWRSQSCLAAQFINLDFESATVPITPPGQFGTFEPIGNALPGWNAFFGNTPVFQVLHNNVSLGSVSINLFGPDFFSNAIFEGDYTVQFVPGLSGGPTGSPVEVSISQSGLVPGGSMSLLFVALSAPFGPGQEPFAVSANGQKLAIVQVSSTPRFGVFGADISAFSAKETELKFTAFYIPQAGNALFLDSIRFSSEAIPEPRVLWLMGLSAVLLSARWLQRRRGRGNADDRHHP